MVCMYILHFQKEKEKYVLLKAKLHFNILILFLIVEISQTCNYVLN